MELSETQTGLSEDTLLSSNWSNFHENWGSFDHQDQHLTTLNSSNLGNLESGFAFSSCEEEFAAYIDGLTVPPEHHPVAELEKEKKIEKKSSKNIMAERRRRRRVNHRLSLLRSVVPNISKKDKKSILGDAIDYIKDLSDKIRKLSEENVEEPSPHESEVLTKGLPKFHVLRRNTDTVIELRCDSKPGLLSSTLSTLEALGLDIHQCVISCFSDFSLKATCSEMAEHRRILDSADVKRELTRNAGYGCGRRLFEIPNRAEYPSGFDNVVKHSDMG